MHPTRWQNPLINYLTENQAKELEKDLSDARNLVAKLANIKREINEENLQLDRDQAAADKSSQYALKKIKELREKTKLLEDNLIETQNLMSTSMEDIMAKVAVVDHQEEDIERWGENWDKAFLSKVKFDYIRAFVHFLKRSISKNILKLLTL